MFKGRLFFFLLLFLFHTACFSCTLFGSIFVDWTQVMVQDLDSNPLGVESGMPGCPFDLFQVCNCMRDL